MSPSKQPGVKFMDFLLSLIPGKKDQPLLCFTLRDGLAIEPNAMHCESRHEDKLDISRCV